MAERGDVYRFRRRIGFGPEGERESVVIVQADGLNDAISTLLAVPLSPERAFMRRDPTVVPVSAALAGEREDQVAHLTQLRPVPRDSLAVARSGRLDAPTLARLDHILRLILVLPGPTPPTS